MDFSLQLYRDMFTFKYASCQLFILAFVGDWGCLDPPIYTQYKPNPYFFSFF